MYAFRIILRNTVCWNDSLFTFLLNEMNASSTYFFIEVNKKKSFTKLMFTNLMLLNTKKDTFWIDIPFKFL